MAIKTADKTINDKDVKIILVGALDGIKITTQLSKVVLPAMAGLQTRAGGVFDIVAIALENADKLDLENIIKKLFDGATVDEFPIKPNDYFSGNYGELIDFLAFALEANFGSFFEAAILKDRITVPTAKRKQ